MCCLRKGCVYNVTHAAGLSCQAACAGFPGSYPDVGGVFSFQCAACIDCRTWPAAEL